MPDDMPLPRVARNDGDEPLRPHVEREGAGPPVLLLHGFTGSTRSWDDVSAKLKETCTVIAVDLPGHGRSPAPNDPAKYRMRWVAKLLAGVLDDQGIDAAVVAGYSMGGRTALRFALSHPTRCAGLVLVSTSPGISDAKQRQRRRSADAGLADMIERDGVEAFTDWWERLPLWSTLSKLKAPRRQEVQERLRAQRLAQSPVGLANSLRGAGAASEVSVLDQLASLQLPALLMAGALDPAYVAHARTMGERMPHAEVHVEPGAGHALHLEAPMRVASLLNRFVHAHSR